MEILGILLALALIGGAVAFWVNGRRRDPDRVARRFGGGSNR